MASTDTPSMVAFLRDKLASLEHTKAAKAIAAADFEIVILRERVHELELQLAFSQQEAARLEAELIERKTP
jgi:hypothetical protein